MQGFHYSNDRFCAESVPLAQIAEEFGTPSYVYSRQLIEQNWREYDEAFADRPHLICYSVKANSNLAILNLLARLGSGFDVVSGGELERVIKAGGDPKKTVFSGIGKGRDEMNMALNAGIKCFNVESNAELSVLEKQASEMGMVAPVSIRVNPDVDAKTHPYISTGLKQNKFGIDINQSADVYHLAAEMEHINIVGIDCHIGSQITSIDPYIDACNRLVQLISQLQSDGIPLQHIDIGGGLGIRYKDESPPTHIDLISSIIDVLGNSDCEILIEPGRSIIGKAGVLLTEVLYLKKTDEKNFAIVDAAMNDLIRPVLYDAWQEIVPVRLNSSSADIYDVVGPVCESGDFLGKDRSLAIGQGDLLAVCDSGAYSFAMSSNYNTRPRATEILVDGDDMHIIRTREEVADLYRGESILP